VYLKRLELQGFKSFHTRTLFEFGSGITAVVGPNGSGKSNVAESIRWVLGEQQSRSLRARRLEDVIFSGSSQKAPVGMAEVSITLDNSEGWLPVDYAEVVVSRRAFRNGDSEYLLNKTKVRLRDVVDLFLRAQVGQNSYAFMGQGLVEEVLLMRPEERRRLLEEAADVRLLRTRLDEARDRLAATRENLERVNLLLDEISPRLAQLERQASRAAEHSRLADELAATLRELYTQLWSGAQEGLTAARAGFDQKQQELSVTREEVKACEEGIAALATAVEEREKELTARRQRQRGLSDQVHNLDQRLGFDRERVESQTRRRAEVEAELKSLRDERADLQSSIAAVQERVRGILPEIEDAKALIATRRQELNALEQEQSGLRRRIGDAEDQMQRFRRTAAEAEAGLARLGEEETRAQGESLRRTNQKRDLVARLTELGRDFKALQARLVTIDRELADAEHERIGLASMIESGRTAVFNLESESMELHGRFEQLKARYELLQRLQSSAEGVDAGVRFLLGDEGAADRAHREAAEGLVGLVRDIIRVPPGLERAIEAALAENVQALVFENFSFALDAIGLLEEHEGGRAVILPLDSIRTSPPLNINREKGVVGVAARLVRCDNRFRNLVDALLGRVIIVESVALAREVLRRGLGSVVTMDGVLLRPGGALSGGISKAAAESFTRQRELDEIPEQAEAVQARGTEVDARLRREKEALEGASSAFARLEPRLSALRDERARRQNAVLENRGRLILLRSEAASLWAELRRDDQQLDWRARRGRLIRDRDAAQAEADKAGQTLERDREALTVVSSRRNEAIDSVSEAAAAHADLEGEAKSLARQVELLQANISRTEARLKERENSLRQIDTELATLRERSESATKELATAREELTALAGETEPAEGELSHLVSRQRAMRDQAGAARARLLDAERAFLEAESAVKLRGDEIENLRESMAAEGFRPDGDRVVPVAAGSSSRPESGGHPPIRGGADVGVDQLRSRVGELRTRIRSLGPVNEQALADYGESKERFDFLKGQVDDLTGSEQTLLGAIDELEANIRERLKATFAVVDKEFQRYFESFFNGGSARLQLTQPDDYANSGIDIVAQPPGKRINTLAQLSGGERALTSLALLLSLLEAHPSPICVLDEVDAALDETNVGRFVDALRALEKKTQFIIITHNPRTIEAADVIYGVSMGADSTSKVLSLRLADATPT
jgi:chromosome segregation protein